MQIEEVLNRHEVEAQVSGGTVEAHWVSFDLQNQLTAGLDRLRELKYELMNVLGVPDIRIYRQAGRIKIAVLRPDPHPVDLLDLLEMIPALPPLTAVLGLSAEGEFHPILLNLLAPEVTNIFVSGCSGAGKTNLLRTMLLSLALKSKQSQLQLAVIDCDDLTGQRVARNRPLYPLNYVPHLLCPVVNQLAEAAELLAFLVEELEYRQEQRIHHPMIVLGVDNVDELLLVGGEPIQRSLVKLLQDGPVAGIRLLLAGTAVTEEHVLGILKKYVPVRLVGQVEDAIQARAAAGVHDSQAEYLYGQGDFLAVSGEMMIHFQAAYISDYDLHLTVERLHRQSRPTILAQTTATRVALPAAEPVGEHRFTFDQGGRVDLQTVDPEVVIEAAPLDETDLLSEEDDFFDDWNDFDQIGGSL